MDRIGELERKYVNEVLDNAFASDKNYSFVTRLEKEFAEKFNAKYAIAMVNGTVTLHAALEAAGVGEGDEVIVPPLTMSSTNLCVLFANAIPVFADIDPDTWTISVEDIKRKITPRTKAIIPVSLYGLSADIDAIMEIAKEHNITVIEDDAQCFLGRYKGRLVGSTAHMSSFCFQASKHMTAGRFSGLGYGSIGLEKGRISKDDIQSPDYERHIVLGWNYRPSDLCGAVALAQLQRLDELVAVRRYAAQSLKQAVEGCEWLKPQATPEGYVNAYWTMALELNTDKVSWRDFRDRFMYRTQSFMGRERIIARYGDYKYERGLCPTAERIQPRLLQFKTNYWDQSKAEKQAEVLCKTIRSFE